MNSVRLLFGCQNLQVIGWSSEIVNELERFRFATHFSLIFHLF